VAKSRVVFFMIPEPGHILPTLRVAKWLQSEGHAVSYVSIPGLENYFARLGFPSQAILRDILPASDTRDILQSSAGVEVQAAIRAHFRAANTNLADLLASELKVVQGDLLVCDAIIMQRCGDELCQALGIPIVALSVMLPDDNAVERTHVRTFVLCPQEFELPWALGIHADRICYTEASISRERTPIDFPWDPVSPERPLVYCSLGTQSLRYPERFAVLEAIIGAFERAADLNLVMSVGNALARIRSGGFPPNVLPVATAPQLELLSRASLFITHGGLGSLKESIMSGVPALVVPFDMDQPGNAERVAYHRLGVSCHPSECTAGRIHDLVRTVLGDRNTHSGLARMRQIFWARELQRRTARELAAIARGSLNPELRASRESAVSCIPLSAGVQKGGIGK
jgi:UDP:flavonoid glycosyltransferase YjiC (YdhE family)